MITPARAASIAALRTPAAVATVAATPRDLGHEWKGTAQYARELHLAETAIDKAITERYTPGQKLYAECPDAGDTLLDELRGKYEKAGWRFEVIGYCAGEAHIKLEPAKTEED